MPKHRFNIDPNKAMEVAQELAHILSRNNSLQTITVLPQMTNSEIINRCNNLIQHKINLIQEN